MKKALLTITCSSLLLFSFGQTRDLKAMVDSLKYLRADKLDCTADIYWRIIGQEDKVIPFLIEKLSDTTSTNISFHCKSSKLNVAEVSYFALQQIASFPAHVITHIQFDVITDNCWSFFDYFFNNQNKAAYQKMVRDWYTKNHSKFKKKKLAKEDRTDCHLAYKVESYYKWRN
jgi:hypothetical protein